MADVGSPFDHPEFDDHEQVVFCRDASSGLFAIIAIHSTTLGPAAGGCRMRPYPSTADALTDVLRLSRAMSYKNALAGLPLGGGKCVVIADPDKPGKAELLRAVGRHVQSLHGRYWTSIDIGVHPDDADVIAQESEYVFANAGQFPDGFNPSHFTSMGALTGIRAAVRHVWGRDDVEGIRVAVQGVGSTGADLCRRLAENGARLVVADPDAAAVDRIVRSFGAEPADPDRVHAADVDVFAPCALGGVINDATLPELRARAVCGVANNQLARPDHGRALQARGIAYVPDYLVNSGAMIGASRVIFSTPDREAAFQTIRGLYDTILRILQQADAERRPSSEIADETARARIAAGREGIAATARNAARGASATPPALRSSGAPTGRAPSPGPAPR